MNRHTDCPDDQPGNEFQTKPAHETSSSAVLRDVESVARMVGKTPLLRIHYEFGEDSGFVYAKYESVNMTGSIKDRMAIHTIRQASSTGELKPGDQIVEASSGNTGISFAAIGAALGHPVRIYMPNWMSHERVNLIRSFGAEIIPVSREQGGFVGSVKMAEAFAAENENVFLPRQFDNRLNIEAHQIWTGPEMLEQMRSFGHRPDAFVAGVGTGGSVMGIGRCLRERWPEPERLLWWFRHPQYRKSVMKLP